MYCFLKAERGKTVIIHYTLYLENQDTPFDATTKDTHGFKTILAREGETEYRHIPGLDFAIGTMHRGERSEFIIHPKYAFGKCGKYLTFKL